MTNPSMTSVTFHRSLSLTCFQRQSQRSSNLPPSFQGGGEKWEPHACQATYEDESWIITEVIFTKIWFTVHPEYASQNVRRLTNYRGEFHYLMISMMTSRGVHLLDQVKLPKTKIQEGKLSSFVCPNSLAVFTQQKQYESLLGHLEFTKSRRILCQPEL